MLHTTCPDDMTAAEYLSYLHRHASSPLAKEIALMSDREVERRKGAERVGLFDRLTGWLWRNWVKRLQPHASTQSKPDFYLVNTFRKPVERAFKKRGFCLPEDFVVGTLYTGEVNARAIRVPKGGYIVALDQGLFFFLHHSARVVARMLPFNCTWRGSSFTYTVDNNKTSPDAIYCPEALSHFLNLMLAHALAGHPVAADELALDRRVKILAQSMRDAATAFVVSHEYAHVGLKHLESASTQRRRTIGSVEVDQVVYDWKAELEADALGATLALESAGADTPPAVLQFGIELFMGAAAVIGDAMGEGDSSTHPPVEVRRRHLRECWTRPPLKGHITYEELEWAEIIYLLMLDAWDRVKAGFQRAIDAQQGGEGLAR